MVSIPPYRLGLFPHEKIIIIRADPVIRLNPTLQIRSIPTGLSQSERMILLARESQSHLTD